MLKNYLTIALRNLQRYTGYTVINVAGLAVGIACCLLIVLFVRDELSYDRFHHQADRIHRVTIQVEFDGMRVYSGLPVPMAKALPDAVPGIRRVTHMNQEGRVVVRQEDNTFYEDHFLFAEPSFFEVFDFPLALGNPATALSQPFSIVLTPEMAEKYFGTKDPLGQTLTINGQHTYGVTGVLDPVPHNTHLQLGFLASFSTLTPLDRLPENQHIVTYQTYLLLDNPDTAAHLEQDLSAFAKAHLAGKVEQWRLYVEALPDLYLHAQIVRTRTDDLRGDMRYLYIFSAIALMLLLIACVNYTNLATARAARRTREVGIRKVVGARRGQLARQFLGESILLCGFALLLAIGLAELFLPAFNRLVGKDLALQYGSDPFLLAAMLGLMVLVGLLAGSYPALVLSSFQPVHVLKSGAAGRSRGAWLRKGLVIFQFGISAILIVSTLIVQQQLRFVQAQRLGDHDDQIVVLQPKDAVKKQYAAFKNALLQASPVLQVTKAPLPGGSAFPFRLNGETEEMYLNAFPVDYDFLDMMGLELVDGRDFSRDLAMDAETALIVNEAAVKRFGWTSGIGQKLERYDLQSSGFKAQEVIGVVKDFHTSSMRSTISATLLFPTEEARFENILIKVDARRIPEALAAIRKQWEAFEPAYPFEYDFLDDKFAQYYQAEQRLGGIFAFFAFLTIFIACLGLFGLATYMAEQRTKEIGVRKVLGASVPGIVALLLKEFLILVVTAFVLSVPIAYFVMNQWLEDFAYRIDISWRIFLMAGLAALVVALLTVSYQAIRAALADPVKSLRYE